MKAEIRKDGYIEIIAETVTEAFAMRHLTPLMDGESCGHCGRQDQPIIYNASILNKIDTGQ